MGTVHKSPTLGIWVKPKTCEKPRELSKVQGRSMGDIVADLVERYEEELFWKEATTRLDRLRADPVAWREYLDEMAEWDCVTIPQGPIRGLTQERSTGV